MSKVTRSALVPFSAQNMYSLVNDVERYPEFVKGCDKAQVLESTEHSMTARLQVSQSGFSQSFTTQNQLVPNEEINMTLVDGPFEYLTGVWKFVALSDNACKVTFELDFKFKSQLLGLTFGKVFKQLAETMMQSFIERAKQSMDSAL